MSLARTLMIQGTGSHVGKSVVTAAFCHLLARAGYRVAPFKAQNMSNNSFVTAAGGEIGRAQAYQAQAAGVEPHVDMNPILLKPGSDTSAQVIVLGKAKGTMDVARYHEFQREAFRAARGALERLRLAHDVVVIEGAGSPAEINLRRHDISNMRIAGLAESPVLLLGDIERGGVFASLVGTIELLTPRERRRVKGLLINKFRGDPALLDPGLEFLKRRLGKPVLGVLPYTFGLEVDEEDAVAFEDSAEAPRAVSWPRLVVGVLRLPHISNATDFEPLVREPDVEVRAIAAPREFGEPDLAILPGTKSTVADFLWLERTGLDRCLVSHAARGGWVLGICGGYQMLGARIRDQAGVEGPRGSLPGLGLLPAVTVFREEKRLARLEGSCLLPGLEGARVRGYEIHQGETRSVGRTPPAFLIAREGESGERRHDGAGRGPALFGTYLHGLFDHSDFRSRYLNLLRARAGLPELPPHAHDTRRKGFAALAALLRDHVDLHRLSAITGLEFSANAREES